MSEVRIEGLRELRSDFRSFELRLARAAKLAGIRAANLIEHTASPWVPRGPAAGGHLASTVQALPSRAEVTEGGPGFPYTGWLDFGGTINKHTEHPTSRPFIHHGRYIWAAVSLHRRKILDIYQDELMRAATGRGAGLRGS